MSAKSSVFLRAGWRRLIMANYAVDPQLLAPLVPPGTELAFYDGACYVSLVGFLFEHTRIKGIPVPFHRRFPEVNLRFYVRRRSEEGWKRGVVFIRETVSRPLIAWPANWLFREKYAVCPMRHSLAANTDEMHISYAWKTGRWNRLEAVAGHHVSSMEPGSRQQFIVTNLWGFSRKNDRQSFEYHVQHPDWKLHPVHSYFISCAFGQAFGTRFSTLDHQEPESVLLADGSAVSISWKQVIT